MYKQKLFLLLYNIGIVCGLDEGNIPVCKGITKTIRRKNINSNITFYGRNLPNIKNGLFYSCSYNECAPVILYSIRQITVPTPMFYCYQQALEDYKCERLRYRQLQNNVKLLFLSNNLPNKLFYLIDCLVYTEGGRVCHKKDGVDSHTKLVDIGNLARPNELNTLSQEEFICEQSETKTITCDINKHPDDVHLKNLIAFDKKMLLKVDDNLVTLNYQCVSSWCGFRGQIQTSTRRFQKYEPPGGKVYRCYNANKQKICKELYGRERNIYNARDWLSV